MFASVTDVTGVRYGTEDNAYGGGTRRGKRPGTTFERGTPRNTVVVVQGKIIKKTPSRTAGEREKERGTKTSLTPWPAAHTRDDRTADDDVHTRCIHNTLYYSAVCVYVNLRGRPTPRSRGVDILRPCARPDPRVSIRVRV